jgi:ABC-type multidrug transport system fused ATPase/permease subunit
MKRPGLPFRRIWDRIQPYYGGSSRRLPGLAVSSILGGFAEAGLLYAVVRVAVAIAAGEDSVDLSLGPIAADGVRLGVLFGLSGGFLLLRLGFAVWGSVLTARIATETLRLSRSRVFSDFLHADWPTQSAEREGDLQELLSTHVGRITAGATMLSTGMVAFFNFITIVLSALVVSPAAAGISLLGAGLLAVVLRPLSKMTRRLSGDWAASNREVASRVAEGVRVSQEIQVFDVADEVNADMERYVRPSLRLFYRSRLIARFTPEVYQVTALGLVIAAMALVWGTGVDDGSQLGAVVLLLVRALTYSQQLQTTVQQANELAPYLEQLTTQFEIYERAARPRDGEPLGTVTDLRFEEVEFAYVSNVPVIRRLSFSIEPGEAIGLVGASGSGKSTVVQLLLGLRQPLGGQYLVNGHAAERYALDDWYRHFAYVPQDNKLLRATVADNIRFFRSGFDDQAVERAARLAHLHDEIARMPDGYDTIIGSGAADLSGGQRQRMGIARALLENPSVLVLDEPTSALDVRSETLVQQSLTELHGRTTLIIVAHRISTLGICDKLMVLREGRLEAFAAPDEVATSSDFYRDALRLSTLGGARGEG